MKNKLGWQCPGCGINYAPSVESCECTKHAPQQLSPYWPWPSYPYRPWWMYQPNIWIGGYQANGYANIDVNGVVSSGTVLANGTNVIGSSFEGGVLNSGSVFKVNAEDMPSFSWTDSTTLQMNGG